MQEIFEARSPKGAPIAEAAGLVRIEDTDKTRKLVVVPDDGAEEMAYPVSKRTRLLVEDGQAVEVGQQMTVGKADPADVLRILGPRKTQEHLVDQVQEVYRRRRGRLPQVRSARRSSRRSPRSRTSPRR